VAAYSLRGDQTAVEHRLDILEILAMAAFDFGKSLGIEVIVITAHA